MALRMIYQNGEVNALDCELYDPFPKKKGFNFVVQLLTKGGGIRKVETEGSTSAQDAIDYVKTVYPDCDVQDISLKA